MDDRASSHHQDRSRKPGGAETPSGYAAIPREVTRREDLSGQAHKVLTAILGLCYGDERHTRASVRQISSASGMRRRTVEYWLAELTRASD